MSISIKQLLSVTAFVCVLAVTSRADNLLKIAQQHEREFMQAMKMKDIGWFKRITAADFYDEERDHSKYTRAQSLDHLKKLFAGGGFLQIEAKVISASPIPNGMLVKVRANSVMKEAPPKNRKAMTYSTVVDYAERWTKDHGHWKLHAIITSFERSVPLNPAINKK